MKKFVRVGFSMAAFVCGGALLAVSSAGARPYDSRGCTVWQERDYVGSYVKVPSRGQFGTFDTTWDDRISAVQCDKQCFLRGWADQNFSGSYRDFQPSTSYVGDQWNDRISSVRVGCQ